MNRYILCCTEEQTKKALELGAPLEKVCFSLDDEWHDKIPTAEQMIGWLEEQGLMFNIATNPFNEFKVIISQAGNFHDVANIEWNKNRREAILSAIDAALDYLIKNKENFNINNEL